MNWDKAECAGVAKKLGYDPFFPNIVDDEGNEYIDDGTIWAAFGDTTEYYEEAKKICDVCPIREACLAHALEEKERYGMWGGTTPIERRRVERRQRRERLKERRANEQPDD